jgi:hypothetical protein
MSPEFMPALGRGLVIGAFGGAALVLTQLYSRRGPLIYPVYAAILFVLGLALSRTVGLSFLARVAVALSGMLLSTLCTLVATMVLAARVRRRVLAFGQPVAPGYVPVWGFPLILLVLIAASAGVAYVSS